MKARHRVFALGAAASVMLPCSAQADVCGLDLVHMTSDPSLDYLLIVAEAESTDLDAMVVCLAERPGSDRAVREVQPILVGYLDREHCRTADVAQPLEPSGATGADILVASTSVALGSGGLSNGVYGEAGYDSLHGSGQTGMCDGGSPDQDSDCSSWVWPWPYSGQGDCCCTGCTVHQSCRYGDAGHGAPTGYDPW